MKTTSAIVLVMLTFICLEPRPSAAQEEGPLAKVDAIKLSGTLFELTCNYEYAVNAIASVGPDGVLLVDAGFRETAGVIRETLAGLGGDRIRYIISTHIHDDHVGGNAQLGEDATIIAHPNTRRRMSGGYFSLPLLPVAGAPTLCVDDEITLQFNGEEIRIFHPRAAHTDGDLVVHFTGSGVICLGDLLFSEAFPFVDIPRGGDVELLSQTIKELVDTLPAETVVIAGHGRHLSIDELRTYFTMLEQTVAAVRGALVAGMTVEEISQEGVLERWASWNGEGLTSSESWVTWIHDSLERRAGGRRRSICAPLTETIMESGVAAAVKHYQQLAASQSAAYDFGEGQLNILGYQLLLRSMTEEAIEIFKLNVQAYSASANVYDSLGEAYMIGGETELAIKNYEHSLELDQANDNAVEKLEQLKRP